MNLVFMGTPDFAVPSLLALIDAGLSPRAVVTAPDKPRGRGRHRSGTPVSRVAAENGLTVLQPESLRSESFIDDLRQFDPDLFVVVAFRILPETVFTLPQHGSINLHASLLPKYRGAAPINWALINGEQQSGVTTFFLKQAVDTGAIILQEAVDLHDDMTAGELHDLLAQHGAHIVVESVRRIADGSVQTFLQDDTQATPAPKIFRETCHIEWNNSARELHNFVRGLSPSPAAWTLHENRLLKILRTTVLRESGEGRPGSILRADTELHVQCGTGALRILELQQEGKRAMTAGEFLRGYRFVAETKDEQSSASTHHILQ
jgi:methionyl-tRNA formyltransferase